MRFLKFSLAILFLAIPGVMADTPEVLISDPAGVSGFELTTTTAFSASLLDYPTIIQNKGLLWWSSPGICPGGTEFPHNATIRVRGTISSATRNVVTACDVLQSVNANVVRDDAYVYFFRNRQLHRQAINASESDSTTPMTTSPYTPTLPSYQPTAFLEHAQGFLYWGRFQNVSGNVNILRLDTEGSSIEPVVTLSAVASPVQKMKFCTYVDAAGASAESLLILLEDGRLYRYRFGGSLVLLGSGILDFAVHTRSSLFGSTTSAYSIQGDASPGSAVPGRLLKIDVDTAASSVVYTAPGRNKLVGVAADSAQFVNPFGTTRTKYIYLSEASITCDLFCLISDVVTKRSAFPASSGSFVPIVVSGGGGNLRSDDRFLYFTDYPSGTTIKRISTGAAPIEFDVQVDGLEVNQAIQTLNNDSALVANKDGIFVRGYAHLRANTTGLDRYFPVATLRVYLNGSEIAGSPFSPINNPSIDGTTDMALLRTNREASFLFQLPPLPPGSLGMTMTVNPNHVPSETGVDPYGNNTATLSPPLAVVRRGSPPLVLVPINTPYGFYSHKSPGLPGILRRAKSLLPVEDFKLFVRFQEPLDDLFVRIFQFFTDPKADKSDSVALAFLDDLA